MSLVMPLEQSCQAPGRWLIEGYDAVRVKPGAWQIRRDGKVLVTLRTLTGVREWIADEREI